MRGNLQHWKNCVLSELKQLTFRADRGIVGQHLKKRGI